MDPRRGRLGRQRFQTLGEGAGGSRLAQCRDGAADLGECLLGLPLCLGEQRSLRSESEPSTAQSHELAGQRCDRGRGHPGWLRSEIMLESCATTEQHWRDAPAPPAWATSESPRYIGRAVAALATDRDRVRFNQQSVTVGDLAHHYGFTESTAHAPDAWRYITNSETDPNVDPTHYR